MTALGTVIPRALTLYMDRMKVVLAKEKRPLVSDQRLGERAMGRGLTEDRGYR